MTQSRSTSKQWRFFRAGGFDQVKLETGADLMALDQLDLKLWVALACPASGLEIDKATLALIDTDNDGRVRAPELIAAVKWAGGLLRNPDDLLKGVAALPVGAINENEPEGKMIASFARKVLAKKDADLITLEETAAAAQTLAAKPFNGDGIVPADSAEDDATKVLINDVIATVGPETDASGKPGVSQSKVDQFFGEAAAYSDWWKNAEVNAAVLPLGLATPAAAAAVQAAKTKIDDFFTRCRIAAFDPRALNALNREEKDFLAMAPKELSATTPEVASLPIARVAAGASLPLGDSVNPAWAGVVATLKADAVKPLLGDKSSLSEEDWSALLAKLAPFDAWSGTKAGGAVEKIGIKRVREILAGKGKETLTARRRSRNPNGSSEKSAWCGAGGWTSAPAPQ